MGDEARLAGDEEPKWGPGRAHNAAPAPPRPPMGLGDEGDRLIAHRTRLGCLDRPIESVVWGALGVVLYPPYAPYPAAKEAGGWLTSCGGQARRKARKNGPI